MSSVLRRWLEAGPGRLEAVVRILYARRRRGGGGDGGSAHPPRTSACGFGRGWRRGERCTNRVKEPVDLIRTSRSPTPDRGSGIRVRAGVRRSAWRLGVATDIQKERYRSQWARPPGMVGRRWYNWVVHSALSWRPRPGGLSGKLKQKQALGTNYYKFPGSCVKLRPQAAANFIGGGREPGETPRAGREADGLPAPPCSPTGRRAPRSRCSLFVPRHQTFAGAEVRAPVPVSRERPTAP